jgi:hypothetical protein
MELSKAHEETCTTKQLYRHGVYYLLFGVRRSQTQQLRQLSCNNLDEDVS